MPPQPAPGESPSPRQCLAVLPRQEAWRRARQRQPPLPLQPLELPPAPQVRQRLPGMPPASLARPRPPLQPRLMLLAPRTEPGPLAQQALVPALQGWLSSPQLQQIAPLPLPLALPLLPPAAHQQTLQAAQVPRRPAPPPAPPAAALPPAWRPCKPAGHPGAMCPPSSTGWLWQRARGLLALSGGHWHSPASGCTTMHQHLSATHLPPGAVPAGPSACVASRRQRLCAAGTWAARGSAAPGLPARCRRQRRVGCTSARQHVCTSHGPPGPGEASGARCTCLPVHTLPQRTPVQVVQCGCRLALLKPQHWNCLHRRARHKILEGRGKGQGLGCREMAACACSSWPRPSCNASATYHQRLAHAAQLAGVGAVALQLRHEALRQRPACRGRGRRWAARRRRPQLQGSAAQRGAEAWHAAAQGHRLLCAGPAKHSQRERPAGSRRALRLQLQACQQERAALGAAMLADGGGEGMHAAVAQLGQPG